MPHVGMISLAPTAKIFDWLRASGKFRLITLRKIFNTIGKTFKMPFKVHLFAGQDSWAPR